MKEQTVILPSPAGKEEQACHFRTERRQKHERNMNKNVKQFAGRPDESTTVMFSPHSE